MCEIATDLTYNRSLCVVTDVGSNDIRERDSENES